MWGFFSLFAEKIAGISVPLYRNFALNQEKMKNK